MADLNAILRHAGQSLATLRADREVALREALEQAREDAVRCASARSVRLFGSEAAALMEPWAPADEMPDDTLVAYSDLDEPYARLIFQQPLDEPGEMRLIATRCRACGSEDEAVVRTLDELAEALERAGYELFPSGGAA